MKKAAILFAVVMLAVVAWGLLMERSAMTIMVNGQPLSLPWQGAFGTAGIIIAVVALFYSAIFLAFALAGIGLIVVGCLMLFALLTAGLMFPIMLPLLIPLAIVWALIAISRKNKSTVNH